MGLPFEPVPEPGGQLVPPNRRPPTAVGVATPPPPPRKYRPSDYSDYRSRIARVAQGLLGSMCLVSAVGLWMTPVWALLGAGLSLAGIHALSHAVTGKGPVALAVGRLRRGRGPAPHARQQKSRGSMRGAA